MKSIDASTTGAFMIQASVGQSAVLGGARLAAAAAAASAVIRETDGSGRILYKLTAVINGADECRIPVSFVDRVHVTVTGAGAQVNIFEP